MDLKLNPATPEFISDLKNVTLDGYLLIKQTVKSSKLFTVGGKFYPLKTNPAFKSLTSDLSGYVSTQIKEIIAAEIPKVVFTEQVGESSYEEQLALSNNNILDRVNSNLALLSKMAISKSIKDQNFSPPEDWYEIEEETPELPSLESIPMEPIRRGFMSPNIWVPTIREKPNRLVELKFVPVYNVRGTAIGYQHPYKYELDMYDPTPWTEAAPEPIIFPAPLRHTNYRFINTLERFDALVRHLDNVDEFAVDLEHHSERSYTGLTCLIQITTQWGDFVIDAIMLWPYIYKLNYSFTDPKKIKILHGADMDVLWLQRDFGVYIVGLFDTFQAAKVLRHESKSLKSLLMYYCNVYADKIYQTADWRLRPLSYAMVRYARTDTHYLLYIWQCMKNELLEMGNGEKTHLLEVFAASKKTCLATYKNRVLGLRGHIKLYRRCNRHYDFKPYNFTVLKKLYIWRDEIAKELDESPSYILPNMMMLELADELPDDMETMIDICGTGPKPLLDNLAKVLDIINNCLDNLSWRIMPYGWTVFRRPTQHMLDLPNTSESRETEDILPEAAGISLEPNPRESTTSNPTGRSEYRFCSPYLRYMKCMKVEQDLNNGAVVAGVASRSNTENALGEFTPIFKDKETREKEAEERANENREDDVDADGFTLVRRRKRNARGRRVENNTDARLGRPGPSTSQAYQYSNRNYTSFSTPRDKNNTKPLYKKRK